MSQVCKFLSIRGKDTKYFCDHPEVFIKDINDSSCRLCTFHAIGRKKCEKRKFNTKEKAEKRLKQIRKRRMHNFKNKARNKKSIKLEIRYYRCNICGFYHLTSHKRLK